MATVPAAVPFGGFGRAAAAAAAPLGRAKFRESPLVRRARAVASANAGAVPVPTGDPEPDRARTEDDRQAAGGTAQEPAAS